MLISGIERLGKRRYLVRTENGTMLVLDRKEVSAYRIEEGADLTQDDYEELMEQQRKECLRRSGLLLGNRDYSEERLRRKLGEAGFDPSVIRPVIDSLKEAGYLDDDRFATQYVEYHLRDRSVMRIRRDLQQQGITEASVEKALAAAEEGAGEEAERQQILDLMRRKNFDPAAADWEERQKFMTFLYRKGYSKERIAAVMRETERDSISVSRIDAMDEEW